MSAPRFSPEPTHTGRDGPELVEDAPGPAPAPATATRVAEPVVRVRNLDRGQVIEVVVEGPVAGTSLQALRRRLRTLASARQPAVLRLDITAATVHPSLADDLVEVAGVLDPFGSRLVVVCVDAALGRRVAGRAPERSLSFMAPGD